MKQILKVIGTSFIMALVVLGILIILINISVTSNGETNKGIFNISGRASTINGVQYSASDVAVYESVMASKAPEIYFENAESEEFIKDKDIEILKYFNVKYNSEVNTINAKNIDENHLKILDITNKAGASFMYLYNKRLKTIKFNYSDIYTITFYLIDTEQKESTVRINIPVN